MQDEKTPKTSKSIIVLQTRDELVKIDLRQLMYVESDGNYCRFVFSNGLSAMALITLSKVELLTTKFAPGKFSRIGKRHIVNKQKIFSFNILKQQMILTDFSSPKVFTLSISKDGLKDFRETYIK